MRPTTTITGVTLTSLNPGELAITWDAPSRAPTDYRVTWKKSDGKWPSYKNENTADGGNAFPTGTSHTVSDLEEGTEYSVRVRARYHNSEGNVEESGPWSDPPAEITVSAQPPSKEGEGDSNEGRSTSPPAKPTGITYGASHNNVLMFWTDPGDDSITGYQILRGPDAANLTVLTEDTGSTDASYSDDTVTAETTYAYAIQGAKRRGARPPVGYGFRDDAGGSRGALDRAGDRRRGLHPGRTDARYNRHVQRDPTSSLSQTTARSTLRHHSSAGSRRHAGRQRRCYCPDRSRTGSLAQFATTQLPTRATLQATAIPWTLPSR